MFGLEFFLALWLKVNEFALFQVYGDSMMPNLYNGELILVKKGGGLKRGDIVVFTHEGKIFVKRLIGVEGEIVKVGQNGVWVKKSEMGDFVKLEENYVKKDGLSYGLSKFYSVPEGHYFLMGDNRLNSKDSRSFTQPFISDHEINGKVIFVFDRFFMNFPQFYGSDVKVVKSSSDLQGLVKKGGMNLEIKNVLVRGKFGEKKFKVEVAKKPEERSIGLMFRSEMGLDEGMFFVFEDEAIQSFWMKNTLIPLDIIFIDKDWKIVDIWFDAQPCIDGEVCFSRNSIKPAKYVLEVNSGVAKEFEIGDEVILF